MENWSTIEISVRQLVKHLIEPTVVRVLDCKDQIDKLNKTQAEGKIKMDGNSIRIDKIQQRLELVDSFSSRLLEFSANLSSFESKLEKDRISNRTKLEEVMDHFSKIKDDIQILEHQREQMRSEVSKTNFMISQAKGFVEEKIREFKDEQIARDMHIDSEVEKAVNSIAGISLRVSQLSDDLSMVDLNSKKFAKDSNKNKSAIKTISKHFKTMQKDFDKKIDNLRHSTVKSVAYAKESIKQMNEFVNNELPVVTSLDCCDLLHNAITELKDLKNLSKAEIYLFAQWETLEIPPDIEERLEKAKERAQDILDQEITIVPEAIPDRSAPKRRKKTKKETENEIATAKEEISQESRQKSLPDELSDLSNDDGINHEQFNEIKENIALLNDTIQNMQSEITDTANYAKELEQEIKSNRYDISMIKVDFQKEIEDLSDIMKDKINQIHETDKAFDTHIQKIDRTLEKHQSVHQDIYKDFEKLKEYFEEVSDMVDKRSLDTKLAIEGCLHEYKAQSGQRRREMSDVQTEFKKNRTEYNSLLENTTAMSQDIEHIQKSIIAIYESLKIQTTLELQDEHDKNAISLLGISEKSKTSKFKAKPSIHIDKQCGTCAYPNLTTKNAFKMACLAYTPSNVVYNKTSYTRKELIEAKQRIITNIETPSNIGVVLETLRQHRPQTSIGFSSRNRYSVSPVSTAMMSQSPDDIPRLYKK